MGANSGPLYLSAETHLWKHQTMARELKSRPPYLIINHDEVEGTQSDESAVCQAKLSPSIIPLLLLV